MLDDLKTELSKLDEEILNIAKLREHLPYEEYHEKHRPQHISLLRKKWAFRQQLFELIQEDKMSEPEAFIPHHTFYCYSKDGMDCPFWAKEKNFEHKENGYCFYLKQGDWDSEGFSIIWDMVKGCGVSEYPE